MGTAPGAALFTRRAVSRTAAPKVALGDTNFELAQPPVDPRRERMDDPQFQTQDARDFEPRKVQAGTMIPILQDVEKLKSRFEALKGSGDPEKEKALDDITSACDLITHHVLDITEDSQAPKAARKARLFQRQAKQDTHEKVILTLTLNRAALAEVKPLLEDLQAMGSQGCSRSIIIEDWGRDTKNTTHGFDGDGPSKIFEIKVSEDKTALVQMHTTPPKGAPRPDQRTHLDEDFKAELDADKDPDLIRHTTGKSAATEQPLLEALSALVHKQWTGWSQGIAEEEDLSDERMDRWEEECWMPYSQLSEEQKEKDRVEARQVIKLLERRGINLKIDKTGRLFV